MVYTGKIVAKARSCVIFAISVRAMGQVVILGEAKLSAARQESLFNAQLNDQLRRHFGAQIVDELMDGPRSLIALRAMAHRNGAGLCFLAA